MENILSKQNQEVERRIHEIRKKLEKERNE
jgi:hypothetical protein